MLWGREGAVVRELDELGSKLPGWRRVGCGVTDRGSNF